MRLKIFLLSLTSILIFINPANAVDATSVTIGSFKYTLTKIELSQDGGQTFTEVFSGSKETNFGSTTESANQKKETICQNIQIPNGTYNYLRITRSGMGRITWQATFPNGHTYYLHSDDAIYEDTPPASESTFPVLAGMYDGSIDSTDFTEGNKRTIYLYANLGNFTISANGDYTVFTITVYEAIIIGDLTANQTALLENNKTYTITTSYTFQAKR